MKIVSEKIVSKRRPGVPGAESSVVTVQQLAGDYYRWRVGFAGQGRYFRGEEEMRQYLYERFGAVMK